MTGPGPSFPNAVFIHPDADVELMAARPPAEIAAIRNAIEKLRAEGVMLAFPHCSAVAGSSIHGLRELRPRAGRSRWRPLYLQVDEQAFLILAVAPEAQIDKRGFRAALDRARARWASVSEAPPRTP